MRIPALCLTAALLAACGAEPARTPPKLALTYFTMTG
jgi:hypothetical protein